MFIATCMTFQKKTARVRRATQGAFVKGADERNENNDTSTSESVVFNFQTVYFIKYLIKLLTNGFIRLVMQVTKMHRHSVNFDSVDTAIVEDEGTRVGSYHLNKHLGNGGLDRYFLDVKSQNLFSFF